MANSKAKFPNGKLVLVKGKRGVVWTVVSSSLSSSGRVYRLRNSDHNHRTVAVLADVEEYKLFTYEWLG